MKYLVRGVGIDPLTSHLIHVTLERDTFERDVDEPHTDDLGRPESRN